MKISRDASNRINWILDNLVPPILRDTSWFISPIMRIVVGPKYKHYLNFKDSIPNLSEKDIYTLNEFLADSLIDRDTHLNKKSLEFVIKNVVGSRIIDVGCGRGYLARKIAESVGENVEIYGLDGAIEPGIRDGIIYEKSSILNIPYEDKYFDTTICTHTLEHIKDINTALNELRRITSRRLIIVVPKQREYRYTFDPHIHFFPYLFSLKNLIQSPSADYYEFNMDFICIEDFDKREVPV